MRHPQRSHLRHRATGSLVALLLPLSVAAVAAPTPGAVAAAPTAGPTAGATAGPTAAATESASAATGVGGSVSSPDAAATQVGLDVLADGGNAVDAVVATAAALGATEPLRAGLGAGGFLLRYNARSGQVATIDGSATAPHATPKQAFRDPATGDPYPVYPELATSGLAVGVPGALATWRTALHKWGTKGLRPLLLPASDLANKGVVVDQALHDQIAANADRFAAVPPTARLFLPGGEAPAVGSTFRNPALGKLYDLLRRKGADAFYDGPIGRDLVDVVRRPPRTDTDLPVPGGRLRLRDLQDYRALVGEPHTTTYEGMDVHTMAGSSLGGGMVSEALRILERYDLPGVTDLGIQHLLAEAGAVAFADQERYVGDRAVQRVRDRDLLSRVWAAERACTISTDSAQDKPVAPGDVRHYDGRCPEEPATSTAGAARSDATVVEGPDVDGTATVVVTDLRGSVAIWTTTLERTGGSGIVVPGRGFLLNDQLVDFGTEWRKGDPNRIEPDKRPRSLMAPVLLTDRQGAVLALAAAGGEASVTTELALVVDLVDRLLSPEDAVADPREVQANSVYSTPEQGFLDEWGSGLQGLGHLFTDPAPELGSATGAVFDHRNVGRVVTAVAEPERWGGGSAGVVTPR